MTIWKNFRQSADRAGGGSLRRRYVVSTGGVAIALLVAVTSIGSIALSKSMKQQQNAVLSDAARRSALLVDRVLAERLRQVDLIAWESSVIDAAKKGTEVSRRRGLPLMTISALEERFKATRSQQVDSTAMYFLLDLLPKLDIAEVMLTDQYGYNAVVTSPSSDFVQSDEDWWQIAWKAGMSEATATEDAATGETVVELARAVRDHGRRVGVVKAKFGLANVDSALIQAGVGTSLRVDLVDSVGHIIASSAGGKRFRLLTSQDLRRAGDDNIVAFGSGDARQRGAVAVANRSHWRLVAHGAEATLGAPIARAQLALLAGAVVVLIALVGALVLVSRSIEHRITSPAAALAELAEAVAAGDLSRQVLQGGAEDEIGRLSRAIGAMVAELRRLAIALGSSAQETSAMSAEITAGTEEMAASAGEIAHTASELSQQSTGMAQSIQLLSTSAEQLVRLAAELRDGAHEGVSRNEQLRGLSLESRTKLDESSKALAMLAKDVRASASAIEGLAAASLEVRSFVTLVQKLARQSKLLALNAAMEAARAGEHGQGFAVVASEVRRLAAMSSEAAQRTEQVMGGVLRGIDESRASSERSVSTVRQVLEATEHGARSFVAVEEAVQSTEEWTTAIERAATSANSLVAEITSRLTQLSSGTESFAAAMQQVAASSEEQSASTQEIAAAAAALSSAAERLSQLVANLRLESSVTPTENGPPEMRSDAQSELRAALDLTLLPSPARA
ncbi:MAG TPA: methyl-accepting chemotaxis protein [Gemmatimonadaceae bacterium]|nr:methyl-accepting chemotaxis protein [Gemmatimonadaceae bacterium]